MNFRSIPGCACMLAVMLATTVVGCGKHDAGEGAAGSASAPASTGAGSRTESSGTGATGGASGAGTAIDDSVITTKLKTAMLADATLKGTDIAVETRNGEVLLTGSVSSAAQKDHAGKVAQAISGVKGVNNKINMKK